MLPVARLRAILPQLPRISIHGPWYRTVGFRLLQGPPPGVAGGPPQPLWPGGAGQNGARFTPLNGFGTIYLASDTETALLEVGAIFKNPHGPPLAPRTPPWTLVSVDGILVNVLDLTDPSIQAFLGTSLAELTGQWVLEQQGGNLAPTQQLGQAAYGAGDIVGVLYVPAKNPLNGRGIAVFLDRLTPGAPSYLQVYDPDHVLDQRLP